MKKSILNLVQPKFYDWIKLRELIIPFYLSFVKAVFKLFDKDFFWGDAQSSTLLEVLLLRDWVSSFLAFAFNYGEGLLN